MRSWMIAFSLGIALTGLVPVLPQPHFLYPGLLLPLLCMRFPVCRLGAAFSLGALWALLWAQQHKDQQLAPEFEGRDLWVTGIVSGLPRNTGFSQNFTFTTLSVCTQDSLDQCRFDESERDRKTLLLNYYGQEIMQPGQFRQLQLRLKRPHGFANPGGFDYEAWLLQQGIAATGYIRPDGENRLLGEEEGRPYFNVLRYRFRDRLRQLFPQGLSAINLVLALTIGDRYQIGNEQWDLFAATGTTHLMVISGLHVGLVAVLAFHCCRLLMACFPTLLLRLPAPRVAALGSVLAAFFYAGMAGFSLPTLRAVIMILVLMWGRISLRETSAVSSLCLALGLILAVDPLAAQSSGFWLSFAAVAILVCFVTRSNTSEMPAGIQYLKALLKTQVLLVVGMLPPMLILFQQTSVLAPLVNLIAVPLLSLLIVPLCLAGMCLIWLWPAAAFPLFLAADHLLAIFMKLLSLSVEISPLALVEFPALPFWAIGFLITGTGLLLFADRWQLRCVGLLGLLPLCFSHYSAPAPGSFRFTVLDVGQGLAVVVETEGHSLIYDTGPAYSERFNAGSGVVLPFLRARNMPAVDKVVVSHGDSDHAGGLPFVAHRFPEARYLTGTPDKLDIDQTLEACRQGQDWEWDGVKLEFLHPDESYYSSNNGSCVLRISNGVHTVLLTGDIERSVENRLLATHGDALKTDILVAPHHGSATSSSVPFIRATSPAYVIFSAGYRNSFRHPHPDVSARYRQAGAVTINTAVSGAVSFTLSRTQALPAPSLWRRQRRRYWSSEPNPEP